MMVELAERLGRSHIYGLLNPYEYYTRDGASYDSMEASLVERLAAGDKKLYLVPYWIA